MVVCEKLFIKVFCMEDERGGGDYNEGQWDGFSGDPGGQNSLDKGAIVEVKAQPPRRFAFKRSEVTVDGVTKQLFNDFLNPDGTIFDFAALENAVYNGLVEVEKISDGSRQIFLTEKGCDKFFRTEISVDTSTVELSPTVVLEQIEERYGGVLKSHGLVLKILKNGNNDDARYCLFVLEQRSEARPHRRKKERETEIVPTNPAATFNIDLNNLKRDMEKVWFWFDARA